MKIAAKSFKAEGIEFPAGSFVIAAPADAAAVRAAVQELGLTAAALASMPDVAAHDADVPRVAMYSSWTGTQEIGWVRFTFDRFGIPYELIYKERVKKGNLRADYDVIVMPTQNASRQAVFQQPADRPVPYMKGPKYKFLGMYGETPDVTGGMGGEGVDAFAKFLETGGTLIAMGNAVRFPTELGFARTVDASGSTSSSFYAPRPLVEAEVLRVDHREHQHLEQPGHEKGRPGDPHQLLLHRGLPPVAAWLRADMAGTCCACPCCDNSSPRA